MSIESPKLQPGAKFALLTDSSPFVAGGRGCNILTWNLLQIGEDRFPLVIGPRPFPESARRGLRCESMTYARWPNRLAHFVGSVGKGLCDAVLFLIQAPRMAFRIRASGATHLFAFCGADWRFLPSALILRYVTGLPMHLYFVDDFESSVALRGGSQVERQVAVAVERLVLSRAEMIWAISIGYCKHLRAKYGVQARWLPVAVLNKNDGDMTDVRERRNHNVVFIGSLNALYTPPIIELAHILQARSDRGDRWRLVIATGGQADEIMNKMGIARSVVSIIDGNEPGRLRETMRHATALFVPYSSDENVATMVQTSFPTKLTDCLTAGRPIIIYGPKESSTVEYAKLNDLPFVASNRDELNRCLDEVREAPMTVFGAKYDAAIRRWHSSSAIEARLAEKSWAHEKAT